MDDGFMNVPAVIVASETIASRLVMLLRRLSIEFLPLLLLSVARSD
jgi:hypothetical protein